MPAAQAQDNDEREKREKREAGNLSVTP